MGLLAAPRVLLAMALLAAACFAFVGAYLVGRHLRCIERGMVRPLNARRIREAERARIRAALEGLYDEAEYDLEPGEFVCLSRAVVLAAIEGAER